MASLVLLLSELVHLQDPSAAILDKLLSAAASTPTMSKPAVQKQPRDHQLVEEEEDFKDLRICIDDQVWP